MLSSSIASFLLFSSFLGSIFAVLFLFTIYESGMYENKKLGKTATFFAWGATIALLLTVVYSLISLFHSSSFQEETRMREAVKDKYGITLNEKQARDLHDILDEIDEDEEPLYASGSTIVDGREMIAVWKGKKLYLMEFKNGSLVEVSPEG